MPQDWTCETCGQLAEYSNGEIKLCKRHWEELLSLPNKDKRMNDNRTISIIFPTRGRTVLLSDLLDSIGRNTKDLSRVEILIAHDADDTETLDHIDWRRADPKPVDARIRWVQCDRSTNFSRDYYSRLAAMATGRWICVINDDTSFDTPDWDSILEETMNAYIEANGGPDIVYGYVEDCLGESRLTQFNDYTCFPVLGKQGVDAMGFVFPDYIPTWGADIWARFLYGIIDRIVKVPITIRHICHHNGTREQDEINKEIQRRMKAVDMNPQQDQIRALKRVLNDGQ